MPCSWGLEGDAPVSGLEHGHGEHRLREQGGGRAGALVGQDVTQLVEQLTRNGQRRVER